VAPRDAKGWFSSEDPPPLARRNAAGGVPSNVSRFVVRGGAPRTGAESAHGQCDSSIRPASAGQMILTTKEPSVDFAALAAALPPGLRPPGFSGTRPAT
jgi:hypothetical protein